LNIELLNGSVLKFDVPATTPEAITDEETLGPRSGVGPESMHVGPSKWATYAVLLVRGGPSFRISFLRALKYSNKGLAFIVGT
jgi:hypothetical protein